MKRIALVVAVLGVLAGTEVSAARIPGLREIDGTLMASIAGECHVDSRVNAYINVYINGQFRGTITPYGDIYPLVRDFTGPTALYAVTTCGRFEWRRTVFNPVGNYHWILTP